jgi:hypothetical protein
MLEKGVMSIYFIFFMLYCSDLLNIICSLSEVVEWMQPLRFFMFFFGHGNIVDVYSDLFSQCFCVPIYSRKSMHV